MKKTLLIIAVTLQYSIFAQVGIGTKTPQEMLHVEGTMIVDGVDTPDNSLALVGADALGNLTTLALDNNLTLNNNKLEFTRSPFDAMGTMDISSVPTVGPNRVHNLDLQLGVGETNEGKTVIKIIGTPANIKLTGIQDGVDGMHLFFYHLANQNVFFIDESDSQASGSLPKNRIRVLASSETISGQGCVEMVYDGAAQRWLFLSIHD